MIRDPIEYLPAGSRFLNPDQGAGWYFHEPREWYLIDGPHPDEMTARDAFRNYCDAMIALGPY